MNSIEFYEQQISGVGKSDWRGKTNTDFNFFLNMRKYMEHKPNK